MAASVAWGARGLGWRLGLGLGRRRRSRPLALALALNLTLRLLDELLDAQVQLHEALLDFHACVAASAGRSGQRASGDLRTRAVTALPPARAHLEFGAPAWPCWERTRLREPACVKW